MNLYLYGIQDPIAEYVRMAEQTEEAELKCCNY